MELAKIEEAFEDGKMMKDDILLRFCRYVGLKRRRSCKKCYSSRSHRRGMSIHSESYRRERNPLSSPSSKQLRTLCLMRSVRVKRLWLNCKKRCFVKAKS